MVRSVEQQSIHDIEVARIARDYLSRGYEVQADIEGWSQPNLINGSLPDVIAAKKISKMSPNGTYYNVTDRIIVEVETAETLNSPHAKKQKEAFEKAKNDDSHTIFWLREV